LSNPDILAEAAHDAHLETYADDIREEAEVSRELAAM